MHFSPQAGLPFDPLSKTSPTDRSLSISSLIHPSFARTKQKEKSLRWSRDEKGPLRLSSIVGAEIRGRAVSLEGLQVEGTLRLEETLLEWRERTATVTEPVTLAFRLRGMPGRVLSIPQIQLAGPGLEIGMAGSTSLKEDGPGEIEIRDLRAKVENWQAACLEQTSGAPP